MVHYVGLRFSVGFGCMYLSPQYCSDEAALNLKVNPAQQSQKFYRHQFLSLIASSIEHIQSCSIEP